MRPVDFDKKQLQRINSKGELIVTPLSDNDMIYYRHIWEAMNEKYDAKIEKMKKEA